MMTNVDEPLSLLRRFPKRFPIRTKLTLAFTALMASAGAAMIFIVAIFMRTIPEYVTARPTQVPAESMETAADDASSQPGLSTTFELRSPTEILNTGFLVSVVVLTILILGGAVAAWVVAGRLLRPLTAINHAAQRASTGSLDHRVGLGGPKDEIRDLSDTFDMMLQRLEATFQAQQRFAANASHELRTPLAATHTMLEVALADPNATADEFREVADRVLETTRRNNEVVEALLDLAEIGQRPLRRELVHIDELVRDTIRAISSEMRDRRVQVTTELSDGPVVGDRVLLQQAVSNLIMNAVRHNMPDGTIAVAVHSAAEGTVLRVENSGVLLTPERVAELAEPFARGTGRTAGHSGEHRGRGLGLAIVTSVAAAHDASIDLAPRMYGGLIATLRLPDRD